MNYCDDLLGLENREISAQPFQFLKDSLAKAGFPINPSKLASPSTFFVCVWFNYRHY